MAKYILFDTETTGTGKDDKILQIGAMILDSKGNIEIYNELCNPHIEIGIGAMEIHNITPEMIQYKPQFMELEFYSKLQQLNNNENYLIAHNLPFDLKMVEKEGFQSQLKHIDTLKCAKHLFPDSKYYRLQYFRYSLDLYKYEKEEAKKYNLDIKAHDAISDVLVMKLFLSKLVQEVKKLYPSENPMIKLLELTNTFIFIENFKFGKYKNKKIVDVYKEDKGYIDWLLKSIKSNEDNKDDDMEYTLNKIISMN